MQSSNKPHYREFQCKWRPVNRLTYLKSNPKFNANYQKDFEMMNRGIVKLWSGLDCDWNPDPCVNIIENFPLIS